MRIKLSSEMDLTQGNLFRKVIKFSIPLMLTSIFQLLYTTVDLWTVKKFGGGSLSMTAIGSNGALINLLITLLLSLSLGSSVTISIAKGANDPEKAERILHTSYVIALVGGVAFAFLGFFLSPLLLELMKTPADIIEESTLYLKIYFIGIPALALVNFGSQMLRALGDSKRPLKFLTISGLANVFLDYITVRWLHMNVAGVAIATVASWVIACIFITNWFMHSDSVFCHFKFNKLKIYREELNEILKIGIPAGLQGLAFSIPNLLIQSSLYSITDWYVNGVYINPNEIAAGAAAAAQIEGYAFVMLDTFCIANVSFTGQNFGAKNKTNIVNCYWYSMIWMTIFWAACCIICLTLYNPLFSIFLEDGEGINKVNAIVAGNQRLRIMTFTYILDGWMDLNGSYLKGMKKSTAPAIITMIGCTGTRIVFLLSLFKMPYFHNVLWLYAAFPISWILVNIAYIPIVLITQKKQFALIEEPNYTLSFN